MEVTPRSTNPQGFIIEKPSSDVLTLRARPCIVQKREHFTPSAQIFRSSDVLGAYPHPGCTIYTFTPYAIKGNRLYDRLLNQPDIILHSKMMTFEIKYRIRHKLSRSMIRHIPATFHMITIHTTSSPTCSPRPRRCSPSHVSLK